MKNAVEQSVVDDMKHKEKRSFNSINELKSKLQFLVRKYLSVVDHQESLLICRVVKMPHPTIMLALEIEANCAVHVFFKKHEHELFGRLQHPFTCY